MKKISFVFAGLIIAVSLISCATTKEIPVTSSSAQIIQFAQNAYEKSDYKSAIACYELLLKRYGTDLSVLVEGEYELGHIYLRTKKYAKAYENFIDVLNIYENSVYGDLPTAYKKLAEIGISQIPEKKLGAIKASYETKSALDDSVVD